jgi:trehalose 6-phosphate synthase
MNAPHQPHSHLECLDSVDGLLKNHSLIIASNRGPVTISEDENGELVYSKGSGGLVTALSSLAGDIQAIWVASALTELEQKWLRGEITLQESGGKARVELIPLERDVYDQYYNVISNPLLWFLQHSMWDFVHAPNIDRETWSAWRDGYMKVNEEFADRIAQVADSLSLPPIIMLQDYHLYLTPGFLRKKLRKTQAILTHFVHIPWPGPEDWGVLPSDIRQRILEGLCSVDLVGFQTRDDALNFIRTCESFLPESKVNFRHGHVRYRRHLTYIRDFPISIDVDSLRNLAESDDVRQYREQLEEIAGNCRLIVRVDRTEPSKNIVRGFQAFADMLEIHPEQQGKVMFLALLVPSRLEVQEYQTYLDELMAAAGRVNARYGTSDWEPVRVFVGEDYARAVAALQIYDVLLVNPVADGMNLVAKEGPIVNIRNGALILSERAGACQQLTSGSSIISPCDISATSDAMYECLTMSADEKKHRADVLNQIIEREDINDWFCKQIMAIANLKL